MGRGSQRVFLIYFNRNRRKIVYYLIVMNRVLLIMYPFSVYRRRYPLIDNTGVTNPTLSIKTKNQNWKDTKTIQSSYMYGLEVRKVVNCR